MEIFALSRFYGAAKQGLRWLEIWADLATVVKDMRAQDLKNESAIHIFYAKLPEPDDKFGVTPWEDWEDDNLRGNAQHGAAVACSSMRSKRMKLTTLTRPAMKQNFGMR